MTDLEGADLRGAYLRGAEGLIAINSSHLWTLFLVVKAIAVFKYKLLPFTT